MVLTSRNRDAAAALIMGDSGSFKLCNIKSPSVKVMEALIVGQPEFRPAITRMRRFFVKGVVQEL